MSARHWSLFLIAPTLFAATPKATPPPKAPVAAVSKPSASPALAKDVFGPGTSLEVITLNDALQAALKNNLDAKIEEIGLAAKKPAYAEPTASSIPSLALAPPAPAHRPRTPWIICAPPTPSSA